MTDSTTEAAETTPDERLAEAVSSAQSGGPIASNEFPGVDLRSGEKTSGSLAERQVEERQKQIDKARDEGDAVPSALATPASTPVESPVTPPPPPPPPPGDEHGEGFGG